MSSTGPIIAQLAKRMLEGWTAGETRDVYPDMMRLTAQVAGQAFFGADVRDTVDEVARHLLVLTELLTDRLNSFWFFIPNLVPTPSNLRVRRAVKRLDALIFPLIEQRRRSAESREDLLARLLAARDEDGSRLTDGQLRDQVMTFFLAGHETTSLLLSWTLYLLAQHREVQSRLGKELAGLSADSMANPAELASLPYLQAVLNETLRLYPPVWVMGRKVIKASDVGDIPLPRGLTVMFSQWVIQRDPRFFAQPEAFLPDRWLDGLQKRLPRYAFFPFGGGQRICIGANFAMMEAGVALAILLRRFRFEPVPGRKVELWPAFTLRPRSGVPLTLTDAA